MSLLCWGVFGARRARFLFLGAAFPGAARACSWLSFGLRPALAAREPASFALERPGSCGLLCPPWRGRAKATRAPLMAKIDSLLAVFVSFGGPSSALLGAPFFLGAARALFFLGAARACPRLSFGLRPALAAREPASFALERPGSCGLLCPPLEGAS